MWVPTTMKWSSRGIFFFCSFSSEFTQFLDFFRFLWECKKIGLQIASYLNRCLNSRSMGMDRQSCFGKMIGPKNVFWLKWNQWTISMNFTLSCVIFFDPIILPHWINKNPKNIIQHSILWRSQSFPTIFAPERMTKHRNERPNANDDDG